MTSVLLSVRPEWCEKIASGQKTVEVRKTKPHLEPPFKCYIYCTNKGKSLWYYDDRFESQEKMNSKVIGEFVCNRVEDYSKWEYDIPALYRHINLFACIDYPELYKYLPDGGGYGWHISDLVIYDKPKDISSFRHPCPNAGPWCTMCRYVKIYRGKLLCESILTRPPQSWYYVEEVPHGS
jgi:predicted transcriptional regulator